MLVAFLCAAVFLSASCQTAQHFPIDATDPPQTFPSTPILPEAAIAEAPRGNLVVEDEPGQNGHPTLEHFWNGSAHFVLNVRATGLPMGESETVVLSTGELWSFVHASSRSAGVVDSCGAPVPFPGCTVIYKSRDKGNSFSLERPVCQFRCSRCPCSEEKDHINQQQYPRVAYDGQFLHLAYEFGAMIFHRKSRNGLTWSEASQVPWTGVWYRSLRPCPPHTATNEHPFISPFFDCLMGGPPGIIVVDHELYIFVAMGQNPGALGCYKGRANAQTHQLRVCTANPLFVGAESYGPPADETAKSNQYFTFRTVSSAEILQVEERYYMLFEGTRGPGPGDPGDTQFGLGLARSTAGQIDAPWELYPANPILVDLPGNIGLGHADLIVLDGRTILYTSLDGQVRSRLHLEWK